MFGEHSLALPNSTRNRTLTLSTLYSPPFPSLRSNPSTSLFSETKKTTPSKTPLPPPPSKNSRKIRSTTLLLPSISLPPSFSAAAVYSLPSGRGILLPRFYPARGSRNRPSPLRQCSSRHGTSPTAAGSGRR